MTLLVFLIFIFLPSFFQGLVLEPTNLPRFLFFNAVLLVGLVFLLKRSEMVFPPTFLFFLLAAFYAMNLLSVSWALNKGDALYESQKVFLGLTTIAVTLNFLRSEQDEAGLIKVVQWVILICCTYPTWQILQLSSLDREQMYAVAGFSGHRNLLASLLMLFVPFAIYSILYLRGKFRYFSVFLLSWLLVLILLLQVRSVYLGTATGLLAFLFFAYMTTGKKKKRMILMVFVVSLIIISILFTSGWLEAVLSEYLASDSGQERLKIWQKTLLLIGDHFWWGVGAANWQYSFMKYGVGDIPNISLREISFQRPHNDLFWVMSETGIFCFLILLLKMGTILAYSMREIIRYKNVKVALFFSFLCGLITDAFFSFPKERITHIVFSCVLFALLLRNLRPGSLMVRSNRIFVFTGIIVLTIGLVAGYFRARGEYYTSILYKKRQASEFRGAISCGKEAISFFYLSDPTSTPIASYIGEAYFKALQFDSALFYTRAALELSPYDYEILSNFGLALERKGKYEAARGQLKEALRINPFFEPARFNLAVVEYNSGNYDEARYWLQSIPGYELKYASQLRSIERRRNEK